MLLRKTYQVRQETVRRKMVENGMTKMLVTNPFNILYLCGANITPYERFMGLLLDAETKKSYLIIPGFENGHCQEDGTLEVTYRDNEDALDITADLINGCKRLGVEKKVLPLFTAERLSSQLEKAAASAPCEMVKADFLLEEMRLHKDDVELEKMAKAAEYTVDVLEQVKGKLVPGAWEQQIRFEMVRLILLEEALMGMACPIQVSSGVHASMAHGILGPKKIESGDPVVIDFGVIYEHYRSDITRTFFVGKPKPEFEKIYQIVLEAQEKAIDIIRPGIALKEVDLAARNHIEQAGYGQYFTTRIGHGLGLEIHELPSMHQENEQLIEEGMTFTIEPGIYIPGVGGVRIEDDIAVTKEGVVVLTKNYPKDLSSIILTD
ncbi:MAG: Xaa-Pro peptidase family protein [Dehalobacterium sp.]